MDDSEIEKYLQTIKDKNKLKFFILEFKVKYDMIFISYKKNDKEIKISKDVYIVRLSDNPTQIIDNWISELIAKSE